MPIEKILNTRVLLRYDSLENWASKNPELKKGEVAIAYLPPKGNGEVPAASATASAVLMKVGPGAFNDLPWMSALAADVYAWAKEASLYVHKDGTGNVVSGVEWDATLNGGKGGIKYTTAAVATAEGLDDLQKTVAAIEKEIDDKEADWAHNTTYTFTQSDDKKTLTITDTDGGSKSITFDYLNRSEIDAILAGYYTKGEVDAIVAGYYTKDEADAKFVEEEGFDARVKGIKVDNAGHADTAGNATHAETAGSADQAGVATKTVAPLTVIIGGETKNHFGDTQTSIDVDTAIAAGVAEAKKYADDNDANTEYHVEYDSTNKKIKLVAGADASKMEIPTDDFIKDGMISSVAISEDGKNLVITWNSDAGKDVTNIPLTELVDIMTGVDGTTITVNVSADDKISAEVKTGSLKDGHIASDAAIAKSKLATDVQTSLGKADTAVQTGTIDDAAGTLTGFGLLGLIQSKKDKQTAVANQNLTGAEVISGVAQSEHGVISVSTRTMTPADIGAQPAGNYATAEQGSKADTALQAADKEALIGTTDDSSSTLSIEGTRKYAKELADENKLAIDAINNAETGILAQAKKDAGDKAAVVLGEAQKYADDEVAALAGEGNTTTVAALAERVSGLETAGHLTEVVAKDYDGEGNEKVSGLKVQNNNEIAIDDSVVFILDCNW